MPRSFLKASSDHVLSTLTPTTTVSSPKRPLLVLDVGHLVGANAGEGSGEEVENDVLAALLAELELVLPVLFSLKSGAWSPTLSVSVLSAIVPPKRIVGNCGADFGVLFGTPSYHQFGTAETNSRPFPRTSPESTRAIAM